MATMVLAPSSQDGDREDPANAFLRWKMAHRAIEKSNPDDDASHLWTVIDAAEATIQADRSAGIEAAERKLWLALDHMLVDADDCRAIYHTDLAPLIAKSDALDWSARLALSAIVSLQKGANA